MCSSDLVIGSAAAFGFFAVLASLMPTYTLFAISLVPVGLCSLTLMTAANATVQLSTAPALRGRVMALYMTIFIGTTPVGAPLVGWVGEVWGPRWSIALGGIVSLLAAGTAALVVRRRASVTALQRAQLDAHVDDAGTAADAADPAASPPVEEQPDVLRR